MPGDGARGPAAPRARLAAAAALALALLAARPGVRGPPAPRRAQWGMTRLETSAAGDRDYFEILSREPGNCSFVQHVRAGTPGFDPRVRRRGRGARGARGGGGRTAQPLGPTTAPG
jgi:hypothetical protein